MILMAVNAAIRQQAHDVYSLARCDSFIDCRANGRVFEKLAITDRLSDASEILIHHAACAEVHVAHFGVAHLAIRQADIHPRA